MHRSSASIVVASFFCLAFVGIASTSHAQPPDARLGELKTLNGHFPFQVPESKEAWEERAERLRTNILVSAGLWPEPERTPLNAVIHGRIERDGFTIEKVYFESLPGHFVTGLLFRPLDGQAATVKRPGILCPHGHGGRMQRFSDKELQAELDSGREKFAESGQTPKLARCAQLARMGCVSFMFDMLGYADSLQIPYEVAHRHKDPRPEEARPTDGSLPESWVMFSIDAELRLQSIMGLQVWNASRALDFLAELPDVDTEKLGVTGNSGGGTQTIILGAIDPRVKVSFPNGMVSTSMQGGCYCENCNLLRVDTGNVELASLMAPRPQAMTAVNDWTRDMMTDGYPQLQQLYRMIGNESDVMCSHFPDFPHSFNYVTRGLMYPWMNRYLDIGVKEPIVEADFAKITDEEGSVWNDEHPKPTSVSPDHERDVCGWFDQQAKQSIDKWWPKSSDELESFRASMSQAWTTILSLNESNREKQPFAINLNLEDPRFAGFTGFSRNEDRKTEVPVAVLVSNTRPANAGCVILLATGGGTGILNKNNNSEMHELIKKLLDQGHVVIVPDLFGQGEFAVEYSGDGPLGGTSRNAKDDWTRQRLVDDERRYAAFTFGYNKTLFAERVADLMEIIDIANAQFGKPVSLVGAGNVAPVTLAAAALTGDSVKRAAIMLGDFRFSSVDAYSSADFVPGAMKYGDIEALAALNAPRPLWLSMKGSIDERVKQCYTIAGASDQLVLQEAKPEMPVDEIVEFISRP